MVVILYTTNLHLYTMGGGGIMFCYDFQLTMYAKADTPIEKNIFFGGGGW